MFYQNVRGIEDDGLVIFKSHQSDHSEMEAAIKR